MTFCWINCNVALHQLRHALAAIMTNSLVNQSHQSVLSLQPPACHGAHNGSIWHLMICNVCSVCDIKCVLSMVLSMDRSWLNPKDTTHRRREAHSINGVTFEQPVFFFHMVSHSGMLRPDARNNFYTPRPHSSNVAAHSILGVAFEQSLNWHQRVCACHMMSKECEWWDVQGNVHK